jgi:putative FmdB family regulatory protein
MPIYEYECDACGHSLDTLQKMSDAPLKDCPACGKPALRKRVSAPQFRLKGAGWYETDFKSGKKRNLAEGGDGGDKKPAKAEPEKSDKPDKKAAPDATSGGSAKPTASSSDA